MAQDGDTMVEEHTQPTGERPATQKPLPSSEKDLTRPKPGMNPRVRLFLIVGVIVLVVAGIFLWQYLGTYESTDDAQIDGHLNSISARVSGNVAKLLIQDNQYVEAGTPLIIIDPADYQVALDRAQADYDDALAAAQAAKVNVPITNVNTDSQVSSADADVDNARAGIAAAQQQYEAAQAQVAQAVANNVRAQSDLPRYQQLLTKQEVSQQQYDQALATAQAAAAAVESAKASALASQQQVTQAKSRLITAQGNLRSAQTRPQQLEAIKARADSAQAQADQKKAALEQAKLNLGYTTIVAPISGVVTNRTVEVGQNVSIGQELFKLINLDDIWVTADFKETQLREMKVGQAVTVHVDATGQDYKGHVQSIAGASGAITSLLPPENATGNYVKVVQRVPVKITLDPGETKQHVLRPGMSAEPKVWLR